MCVKILDHPLHNLGIVVIQRDRVCGSFLDVSISTYTTSIYMMLPFIRGSKADIPRTPPDKLPQRSSTEDIPQRDGRETRAATMILYSPPESSSRNISPTQGGPRPRRGRSSVPHVRRRGGGRDHRRHFHLVLSMMATTYCDHCYSWRVVFCCCRSLLDRLRRSVESDLRFCLLLIGRIRLVMMIP